MLIYLATLLLGFIALIWSADRFVVGASATAKLLGISPLLVGVLIVGFGTSAPEMLISGIAAWDKQPGLAIGNAIGSNITNIGLIIGITALAYPLKVQSAIIRREVPMLLLFMFASLFMVIDGQLGRVDGLMLLAGMAFMIFWSIKTASSNQQDILAEEFAEAISSNMTIASALTTLLVSLVLMVGLSRLLVWAATGIAVELGISDLVIGLTIVALGTSLPELAATIAAARKKEYDIAIGNVAGSNIFNIVGVMALPGIIAPGPFDPAVLTRDYPAMLLLTVLFFLFASNFSMRKGGHINRIEGSVLLAVYLGYMGLLYWQAVN